MLIMSFVPTIFRLCDFTRNNNFGREIIETTQDPPIFIKTPASDQYRDINTSCPVPSLTLAHIHGHLNCFKQKMTRAPDVYRTGFLCFVRYCLQGKLFEAFFYFFKTISTLRILFR